MKRGFSLAIAAAALWLPASPVLAAGTPAGTSIVNKATVTYTVDTTDVTRESNESIIQVAELLDVSLTWQDAGNLVVMPGDTGQAAAFRLTNTGNGTEAFTLSVDNALAGDNFDPTLAGVYLDTNGNQTYEPGIDPLYTAGNNDPLLAADGSIYVFVVNDIPGAAADGQSGKSGLLAAAQTGTGTPGTLLPGLGNGGIDAVIGASGADAAADATYLVSAVDLSVIKSAVVADPFGGSQPVPSAVITYTIAVTVAGSGTARNVIVTDPVPANTTYVANSLTLEGAPVSDVPADDAGEFAGGAITVRLGDLSNSARTVTFQVTIN